MLRIMPGMPILGKVGITRDKNSLLSAWEQTHLFSYLHMTKKKKKQEQPTQTQKKKSEERQ